MQKSCRPCKNWLRRSVGPRGGRNFAIFSALLAQGCEIRAALGVPQSFRTVCLISGPAAIVGASGASVSPARSDRLQRSAGEIAPSAPLTLGSKMPDWETLAWPRAEQLQRVFQVRSDTCLGTAFVLDADEKQYLVSALHVVEHSTNTSALDIYFQNTWKSFPVSVIGIDFDNDVAVLALQERIVGESLSIDVSGSGCIAGQEVFILGYPLGI